MRPSSIPLNLISKFLEMNKWALGIVILVIVVAGIIYGLYEKFDYDFDPSSQTYEVVQKWPLPNRLDEISGIVWIRDNKLACVEDEDGIIFTYDLNESKIISQREFAGSGDFEAITIKDGYYWIAESNGKIYKLPLEESSSAISPEIFETGFEYRNNIEGLTATSDGKLLISVKDHNLNPESDEQDEKSKAVYTYDPATRKLNPDPAFRISISDTIFKRVHTHEDFRKWRPTDLQFHPLSGDIYIIDSEIPKVLVLNKDGRIKKMHLLNPADFLQPEGICFSPSGRVFIANEAKGSDASLVEVKFH